MSEEQSKFGCWIGPVNLLGLVRNTAPFLFSTPHPTKVGRLIEMGASPHGWLDILRAGHELPATPEPTPEQLEDYFALCLACHHATVATFIPTDVDSKIRGVLWQAQPEPERLRRMFELTLQSLAWDTLMVTTRFVEAGDLGPVSGHDGERLSVLGGALGTALRIGDAEMERRAFEAMDHELAREAAMLRRLVKTEGRELDLLRLAALMTHNVGDVDQGLSYWRKGEGQAYREKMGKLAHENVRPYGGAYQLANHLYKNTLAPEGHRNYPLREVKPLRKSLDHLMPLSPFLDGWGEGLGRHPGLSNDERAEILGGLLMGCRKISNQVGYYRAIAGMGRVLGSGLDSVARGLPAALRQGMKEPELRRHLALKQVSFESSFRKKAQVLVRSFAG